MRQTVQGSQGQVDRHAALNGSPGGHLPAVTDGYTLVGSSASGKWVPTALAGGATAASKADPLNLGFPYSVDPLVAANAANIGSANRTYYYRAIGGGTVTKVGLYVAASGATGNVCVSLYANTGTGRAAMPGARVASSGSVACPATGYAEIALGATVSVTSGDFWFAFSADSATPTFQVAPTSGIGAQGRMAWQDAAFPSPASATPVNGAGAGGGSRGVLLIGVA